MQEVKRTPSTFGVQIIMKRVLYSALDSHRGIS
jgi:hypothetical protein